MFYEEKLIDGIMCYRTKPDGEWTQYPTEELSRRYDQVEAERRASRERIKDLEATIKESKRRIKNGIAWLDGYGDDFEMAKHDIREGYKILEGGAE